MKCFVFTKEWLAKELGVESLTPEQESALLAAVAKEAKLLTEDYFGALQASVPADGDGLRIVVERLNDDVDEEMFQSILPEIEQAVDTEVFGLVCRELPTPPLANKSGLCGVVSTYSFDTTSSTMVLFRSEFDAIMYLRKCFFEECASDEEQNHWFESELDESGLYCRIINHRAVTGEKDISEWRVVSMFYEA